MARIAQPQQQLSFMNVDSMNSTFQDDSQLTLKLYLQAVQQQQTMFPSAASLPQTEEAPHVQTHAHALDPADCNSKPMQQAQQQKEATEQKSLNYLSIPIPLSCNSSLGSSIMSASTTPLSPSELEEEEACTTEAYEAEEEMHLVQDDKLVFLDWDDTLFPTTFLITEKQETTIEEMRDFGKSVYDFLNVMIALYDDSNIYIVTNATKDWLFTSLYQTSQTYQALASQYQPDQQGLDYFAAIYNSLRTLNIGVVSAADLYSKQFPNQPLLWKINAFKEITTTHFAAAKPRKLNSCSASVAPCTYSIVSIGDSDEEFTASLEAKSILSKQVQPHSNQMKHNNSSSSHVVLHRIKLLNDPSVSELTKEIQYLSENARFIKYASEPITLRF